MYSLCFVTFALFLAGFFARLDAITASILFYVGIFMNACIVVVMTVLFLRPICTIRGKSKVLEDVVFRTALGGILHLLGVVAFVVLNYIWRTTAEGPESETSILEQDTILAMPNVPLVFHLFISHRDDKVIREVVWHWFSKARASISAVKAGSLTTSPQANRPHESPSQSGSMTRRRSIIAFMAPDEEEEAELRRHSVRMPSSVVEMEGVANPVHRDRDNSTTRNSAV